MFPAKKFVETRPRVVGSGLAGRHPHRYHAKNEPLSLLMRGRQRKFAFITRAAPALNFNRRYIYDNALIVTTKYSGNNKMGQ